MSKYALWTISSRKFYTIIGLSVIPPIASMVLSIWALITGNEDRWVIPTVFFLFHILLPVTLGLPMFGALGAIDVKFPPKKD